LWVKTVYTDTLPFDSYPSSTIHACSALAVTLLYDFLDTRTRVSFASSSSCRLRSYFGSSILPVARFVCLCVNVGECRCDCVCVLHYSSLMPTPTMSDLLAARSAVVASLVETRSLLASARRRATAVAKAWVLTPSMRRAVIAMYSLADSAEPAVAYLQACGRERHWPDRGSEDLTKLTEDLFLQTDATEVVDLTDSVNPSHPQTLAVALRYVEQWRVVAWSRALNTERGIAPSTAAACRDEPLAGA
jgi:hypothetical protein